MADATVTWKLSPAEARRVRESLEKRQAWCELIAKDSDSHRDDRTEARKEAVELATIVERI